MGIGKILKFVPVIVLATLLRIIPHPPNLAPIGALALFSGANLTGISAFIFPLSVMFLSDLVLGFHSTMPYVYLSFFIIVFIGRGIKKNNFYKLAFSSLVSSIVFFIITNFGMWISTAMYSKNLNGLTTCYVFALPFFKNTIMGDLFYSLLFFYGIDLWLMLKKLAF